RISLRAKVTGVTVAVLALGLVVAGIGTVPLLRGSLILNIQGQLPSLATSDLVSRWFDVETVDGSQKLTLSESAPRSADYSFAVYAADGTFLAQAGGARGTAAPTFSRSLPLERAHSLEDEVLSLSS